MTQRVWNDGEAIVFAGAGDGVPHKIFPRGSLHAETIGEIVRALNSANDVELAIHYARLRTQNDDGFLTALAAKEYLDEVFAPVELSAGPPGPQGPPGPPGPSGLDIPMGGIDGQVLIKSGNAWIWANAPTPPETPVDDVDGGFF